MKVVFLTEDDNIVISQSIKANKKIENTESLTITVARNSNNTNDNTTNINESQEESNEDSTANEEITNEN